MPERERVKDHNAKDARRRLYAYLLNREEVVFEEWRREYAYKVLAINPIFEKLYAAYAAAAEATAFASSEQQSSSSFERRYYPYYIVYAINPIFEELYAAYVYYYVEATVNPNLQVVWVFFVDRWRYCCLWKINFRWFRKKRQNNVKKWCDFDLLLSWVKMRIAFG